MTMELQYTSSLNGAAFLLFELKQVLKLKGNGLSNNEIRAKVKSDNVLQFNNAGRANRALPSLLRRTDVLDATLSSWVLEGPMDTAKAINLYAIMKTDRLFFEFMTEVVAEKLHNNNLTLEKKDLNVFFAVKAEQNSVVAGWSATNMEKLKRVFMQVLFEVGILKNRRGNELARLVLDPNLKEQLVRLGDSSFVRAMGE